MNQRRGLAVMKRLGKASRANCAPGTGERAIRPAQRGCLK